MLQLLWASTKNNSSGGLENKSTKQFHICHQPFDSGLLSSRAEWKKHLFFANNPVSSVLLQHKQDTNFLHFQSYAYCLSLHILPSPDVTPRPQLSKIFLLGSLRHRVKMYVSNTGSPKQQSFSMAATNHAPCPYRLPSSSSLSVSHKALNCRQCTEPCVRSWPNHLSFFTSHLKAQGLLLWT